MAGLLETASAVGELAAAGSQHAATGNHANGEDGQGGGDTGSAGLGRKTGVTGLRGGRRSGHLGGRGRSLLSDDGRAGRRGAHLAGEQGGRSQRRDQTNNHTSGPQAHLLLHIVSSKA